jgi:NAD(P)-dependent dehydrogenase (short-subunit alcohol dehydrogenase family)
MQDLSGSRIVVTGGSRGLGLGIVEALRERKAEVTVVARDAGRLAEVAERLQVATVAGDVTDRELARRVLSDVKPQFLVLQAGALSPMAPLHQHTWESFSAVWENDVKAGLFWVQEAIALPLPRGARVLLSSSGAAIAGSPLSGGYAGAKRMLWLMAHYANGVSAELGLGIKFQVIVPRQIMGDTEHGRNAAVAYARKKGVSLQEFFAGFGKKMTPRDVGEYVATILSDEAYQGGTAFGIKGDLGIHSLDDRPA